MPVQIPDLEVWEAYTRCVDTSQSPRLKHPQKDMPPYLNIRVKLKGPGRRRLDLHGYSVQEAYETLKAFICRHAHYGTPKVEVITGRGFHGDGLIKKEIGLWLDTPFFKERIASVSWMNGEGALCITFKKPKKK